MKIQDLLKGAIHEGKPLSTPPRSADNERIDELEAALVELAEILAGEGENDG